MHTAHRPPVLLVVGAAGQLGRAVAEAAVNAGWRVCGLVRRADAVVADGVEVIVGDARDFAVVAGAADGVEVIFHAVNPGYARWAEQLPVTDAIVAAARAVGATIVFPGNVYGYGAAMPATLTATTPAAPTTSKGAVRVEVEHRLRRAADDGVQVIVVRLGSFFGATRGADWFSQAILKDAGVVVWPTADLSLLHAWSFVPDVATIIVRIATARAALGRFEVFCVPGHNVSGGEFLAAIDTAGDALGQPRRRRKTLPWTAMGLLSPFVPMLRSLRELRYLWQTSHALVDDRLAGIVGPLPHTPLHTAVIALLLPTAAMSSPPQRAA